MKINAVCAGILYTIAAAYRVYSAGYTARLLLLLSLLCMPCITWWQLRIDSTKSNQSGRHKTFVNSCCCCYSLMLLLYLLLLLLLPGSRSLCSSDDALPSGQADHLLSANERVQLQCEWKCAAKGSGRPSRGGGRSGLEAMPVTVTWSSSSITTGNGSGISCTKWMLAMTKLSKCRLDSTRRWRFHSVSLVCFGHPPP